MPRDRPPGIWESLKRALAGAERKPEADVARQRPARAVDPSDAEGSVLPEPPFLLPDEPFPEAAAPRGATPVAGEPTEDSRKPPPVPDSPPEPPDASARPRLARGLASFSRSNADREKKFGHLLRDDPSGEKKKPQPPGGRE